MKAVKIGIALLISILFFVFMYADGIELPNEVVEYVAHNIDNNVRELEFEDLPIIPI